MRSQSRWQKEPTWFFPITMRELSPSIIKSRSFQQKLYWFRLNIERLRIPFENGAEFIHVDRSNILMSSKQFLEKADLRKEVKIVFNDQKVEDAGGLMREYMHLALKQLFSKEQGIFQIGAHGTSRFRWDQTLVDQFVIENMKILGLIIGKAIFERISINCYLDRTILRQITGSPVFLEDVYTYDEHIFKSVHSMMGTKGASQIALNFCIYHQSPATKQLRPIQLIPNGRSITVNDNNKSQYFQLMIHHYCTLSCNKYLEVLRDYIYKVIPFPLISIFQPIQLQMLLYGPQTIDVQDWKTYTQYKGYKVTDKQVVWFWEFVQKIPQDKLRHLLHYVTGTTRVPILGFKYLQSNRNQLVRFTIERAEYDKSNPYPKSYTCFNRIHLPVYQTKQQLNQKLKTIVQSQLTHFGLD